MAKVAGLEKMTVVELRELQARVQELIGEKEIEEKKELRSKIEALAAESGFSVTQLFGGATGKRGKGGAIAIKYRNPKDSSQTWSGRGRKPRWITEAEAKGQSLDAFAV